MIIFDLTIEQGSTFSQSLSFSEDLSGYTIDSDIIDSVGYVTHSVASITDSALGDILISITNQETSLMSTGIGYYDIELTNSTTGAVMKPMKGRVYINGEVTK